MKNVKKNEYEIIEIFDNNAEDISSLLKRIFIEYCLRELEELY